MTTALLLFVASWVAGYVLHQAALAALDSTIQLMPGYRPFRCGEQRALTLLEVMAAKRVWQCVNARSDPVESNKPYVDLRPSWVRLVGLIVDLLFFASFVALLLGLISHGQTTFMIVLVSYLVVGMVTFLFYLMRFGEIGKVGYHFRCLLYLALWPVFLAFVRG